MPAARSPWRWSALAAAGLFVLAFQSTLKIHLGSNSGLNKCHERPRPTSSRAELELFANRPLLGYGSGSFGRAYRQERKGNQQEAVSASHTLPVTVAAEQGIVGLAVYVWVLVAAFATLFGDGAAARAPRRTLDGGPTQPVPAGARGARGDVLRARRAHDGLRGVPRGPVHLGDAGGGACDRALRAARDGEAASAAART